MGFSVKIAPGVRVRASSRGLRTSIGGRGARISVGGGATRLSAGAGPIRYSTTVNTGRRRATGPRPATASNATSSAATSRAAGGPSPAALAKAQRAEDLLAQAHALTVIHRTAFPPATRPIAPPPPQPDAGEVAALRTRHIKDALAGVSIFARRARAQARTRGEQAADAELESARRAREANQRAVQAGLDQQWQALLAGDPAVVLATLAEAFADNEAPAAPLDVNGAEVTIAVLAPPPSIVPEQMPATTDAGNLSLRKVPARQRAAMHTAAVMAHVLLTLREAFAVAPSLETARVVVLADDGRDAYGKTRRRAVLAGRWARADLAEVAWEQVEAHTIATGTATELLINHKATTGLQPLNLDDQPDIAALIERVDAEELTT